MSELQRKMLETFPVTRFDLESISDVLDEALTYANAMEDLNTAEAGKRISSLTREPATLALGSLARHSIQHAQEIVAKVLRAPQEAGK